MLTLDTVNASTFQREIERMLTQMQKSIQDLEFPFFAFQIAPATERIPEFERAHTLEIDGVTLKIYYCPTELALRQVLQYQEPALLLTPLHFSTIHREVSDRFVSRSIHRVQPAHQIAALFQAHEVDRRLGRWTELIPWLLEFADQHTSVYTPAQGGILSESEVWNALFKHLFDELSPHENERGTILSLFDPDIAQTLQSLSTDRQNELLRALDYFKFDQLRLILIILWTTPAHRALNPLACALVLQEWLTLAQKSLLEHRTLYAALAKLDLIDIFEKNEVILARIQRDIHTFVLDSESNSNIVSSILTAVGDVYTYVDYDVLSAQSLYTPQGWNTELKSAQDVLQRIGHATLRSSSEAILDSWERVKSHVWGRHKASGARSALKTLHRIGQGLVHAQTQTQDATADRWARNDAFMHQQFEHLAQHTIASELRTLYERLFQDWTKLQRSNDEQSAQTATTYLSKGSVLPAAIPMEKFGDTIVHPLLAQMEQNEKLQKHNLLIIVADGMSWSAFHELAPSLTRHGWVPWYVRDAQHSVLSLQAPIPTETRFARHALLTGTLEPNGDQGRERNGFSEQFDGGRLFHYKDTKGDRITMIEEAIRSKARVVGVVVNAIDDTLSGSSQFSPTLQLEDLSILHSLLQYAADHKRVVVLTSDHGHIIPPHAETTASESSGGARYRADNAPLQDGEVEFSHPLFADTYGNERLRVAYDVTRQYTRFSRGVHGGAHRAEMLVPVAIVAPDDLHIDLEIPAGTFDCQTLVVPSWWSLDPARLSTVSNDATGETAVAPGKEKKTSPKRPRQPTLFDFPAVPSSTEVAATTASPTSKVFHHPNVMIALGNSSTLRNLSVAQQKQILELLTSHRGRLPVTVLMNTLQLSPRETNRVRADLERTLNNIAPNLAYLDAQNVLVVDTEMLRQLQAAEKK